MVAVSTALGGYNGYVNVSDRLSDIKGNYYIVPICAGIQGSENLGGYVHTQGFNNPVIRVSSNRSDPCNVTVLVFYQD